LIVLYVLVVRLTAPVEPHVIYSVILLDPSELIDLVTVRLPFLVEDDLVVLPPLKLEVKVVD